MSVRDALLALLLPGPRHGYQLKAEFEAATGNGWSLNVGQVYSTLQRLERDELVETDGPPDDEGRQAWKLTDAGTRSIADWISTPPPETATARDELSMKLLIALAVDATPALELINDQRTAAMGDLQALTASKARMASAPLADVLHLDRTILLAESQVRWLDLVEERLIDAGWRHDAPNPGAMLPNEVLPNEMPSTPSKKKETS